MMKTIRKFIVLTMTFCLVMGAMAVSVSAYDNKVTVSAGNGEFEGGSDLSATGNVEASADTTNATVKLGDKTVKVTKMPDGKAPASSKYFVTGLKVSGRDNSTNAGSVKADNEDLSLVVAYGLKTDMVTYTVEYRDAATGNAVGGLTTETHYGVIGDKPVVSYKYADGYLPNAYAQTKTLTSVVSDNVITFWYYAVDAEGNVITIVDGVPAGQAAAAAGAPGAAGAPAGAADGTNIGDNATPLANGPANVVDLDDNGTPLADGEDIADSDTHQAGFLSTTGGKIAIAAAIAAAVATVWAILKRRGEYDEDDDEEEEDGE